MMICSSHPLGPAGRTRASSLPARLPLARGASSAELAICLGSGFFFSRLLQRNGLKNVRQVRRINGLANKEGQPDRFLRKVKGCGKSLSLKRCGMAQRRCESARAVIGQIIAPSLVDRGRLCWRSVGSLNFPLTSSSVCYYLLFALILS